MKKQILQNSQKPENNGWSQFETWAGISWFGDKPATPPKECNVPITRKN